MPVSVASLVTPADSNLAWRRDKQGHHSRPRGRSFSDESWYQLNGGWMVTPASPYLEV